MNWIATSSGWIVAAVAASLTLSIGGLWLVRRVIVTLPQDYFLIDRPQDDWGHRHPLVRWGWLISKNILGIALLVAGLTMLVTPGPGIPAILLALTLISLPGKQALIRRMLRNRHLLAALNAVRAQAHREPLLVPEASKGV